MAQVADVSVSKVTMYRKMRHFLHLHAPYVNLHVSLTAGQYPILTTKQLTQVSWSFPPGYPVTAYMPPILAMTRHVVF